MKLGDVLIQGIKIIGFLKEINVEDNIMGFVPAHSVVQLEDNQVESQEVGYMGDESSSSPPSLSPSSPCSEVYPFSHDISPR